MPSLNAAHRGYEYQDLLVAARLVDVALGNLASVRVDEKLVDDDRFDDLTTIDLEGVRERVQFKHSDNDERPITLSTFTGDTRDLALDRLVAAAVADRDGPGNGASGHLFRMVLRDGPPVDESLLRVLRPASPEWGPYLSTMSTSRWRFDATALWADADAAGPFRFLRDGSRSVDQGDLAWLCERLVIELEAPAASGDLTTPGAAEHLLLARIRTDIGAELYPNEDRSAIDVAEAVIRAARAARQGRIEVTAGEILRRARLRTDFGAVARAHPVDRALAVSRQSTVDELSAAVIRAINDRKPLLIVGPPGQGKSWACQQLIERLTSTGWLVAEHYCYLGDADGERQERVLAEAVFGSLLGRVADADPGSVVGHRPRFAADEQALEGALRNARARSPERSVALVIDGLDHITRVRQAVDTWDPSLALAEALSLLELPAGSVLIVLSQPGRHLHPLEEAGSLRLNLPPLDRTELGELAGRLGVVPSSAGAEPSLLTESADVESFLDVLEERSLGNALYATYLCREVKREPVVVADPAGAIRALPAFDGTLESYYQHVRASLGDQAAWVADVIALVDFSLSPAELKEIRPDMRHRVDDALNVLRPVLIERAAQGGLRIYHESFARFLRQPFQDDPAALVALLDRIVTWLASRGMFDDTRAYRSLLPLFAEAGRNEAVVGLVQRDFVVRSLASGFPASAIIQNLAVAVRCATRAGNWPVVARYVELARAAETFQDERFASTLVESADVPMALLGADTFAGRLLHDGRTVVAGRAGLQMCAAVDKLGGVAPWREYMEAFRREAEDDNTSYGEDSDRHVRVAWLRGRLRLSAKTTLDGAGDLPQPGLPQQDRPERGKDASPNETGLPSDLTAPIDWDRLAAHVEDAELPLDEVVSAIADTRGASFLRQLEGRLQRPGDFCLEVACQVADGRLSVTGSTSGDWASDALHHGVRSGTTHYLLALGINVSDIEPRPISDSRPRLLTLTREVQARSVQWQSEVVEEWLDACAIAAHQDPIGLNAAEALIDGPGWYRCWLRFAVALTRGEASHTQDRSSLAVAALQRLKEDLDPFSGDPRSCDLYRIHGTIERTIRRAIAMLDDEGWTTAVQILTEVSRAITTSLFGELGGPLPPDRLLSLVVETAGPTRFDAAEALIREEIESGAARKFYSDLAGYRLLAARLAVARDDRDAAARWWADACRMLTGYGWHKDITIYELLDPLPHLIRRDPARGRARVAMVQPLCERVPMHTDLKETRGAWSTWWSLLALADPPALADLAAPRLLTNSNDPGHLLHRAREYLWRTWQGSAEPVVAAALRLTLDMPLDPNDAGLVARLAALSDGSENDPPARMTTHLLARADERPVEYPYSNGEELLARDSALVEELNHAADIARAPHVHPLPEPTRSSTSPTVARTTSSDTEGIQARLDSEVPPMFSTGAKGLGQAIRAWRLRGHGRTPLSKDGMANAIGYRLVELAGAGRDEEAAAAVTLVTEAGGFSGQSSILPALAQGLERLGQRRLAARAYALAWTRSRGHGGWLNFGGETEIESLAAAARIDRDVALGVIAAEVERLVAGGRFGTYGITQAVIYAFATLELVGSGAASLELAFDAWDEALAVISDRAPRVHPSDDPVDDYAPAVTDTGEATPGDLDVAFAKAALAGLAHPGREIKRRSLLAASTLIQNRPAQVAPALALAIRDLSDPATLTWLLRMVEVASPAGSSLVDTCHEELRVRTRDPHVTVRALARRLLGESAAGALPASSPDPMLVSGSSQPLWIPPSAAGNSQSPNGLDEFIEQTAGRRITAGEQALPGFRGAVHARVARLVGEPSHDARLRSQLDEFADRIESRWPDAFLATEEVIEEAIQLVGGGGRASLLAAGHPVPDPTGWEDDLASAVLDDPWLPIAVEETRQPRPAIPAPPREGAAIWKAIAPRAGREHTVDTVAEEAADQESLVWGTVSVEPADQVESVAHGPHAGWRFIASMEIRTFKSSDRRSEHDRRGRRYRAIEVRLPGDRQALTTAPTAVGDVRVWLEALPVLSLGQDVFRTSQPIIGEDATVDLVQNASTGLGVPTPILTVTVPLISALRLRPGRPFVLEDPAGPALALITWRTEHATSEYHLPWPRLVGSAILLRPDLFVDLGALAGGHLVIRDFIVGHHALAGS